MKALLSLAPGGPETLQLRDRPDPVPAPGELLVRVETCGVNFPDSLIIEDRYQGRFDRPFSPGGEISGLVEQVGEGVTAFSPGDRVVAFVMIGGMAELICVPAANAIAIDPVSDGAVMAQLATTYATSWHGLVDRAHLQAGETLLVLGAAGGVGIAAVDIGKALGARVIAGVSTEEKAELARSAGADLVFLYPSSADSPEERRAASATIKAAVGAEGADIIYDPVGGAMTEAAFRALAWNGRHLVVGFPAGIPALPTNLALLKGASLTGVFMGAFAERDPAAARDNVQKLFSLYAAGRLNPPVTARFPLAEGGQAIRMVAERKAMGKVVVLPGARA